MLGVIFAGFVNAEQVNVYSARQEALIKPLLDKFTKQTGISVNLVTGKADTLISRLQSEGKYSPADLLITTDVGRLYRAKQQGLTQAIDSEFLNTSIANNYQDPDKHWYALTLRARPIMYAPDRVDVNQLSRLEDLTDEQWKGRICVRSSNNIYNQSMVAAMLEQLGQEDTEIWVKGFVENFARPPNGGDRDQIKAVASGQCDIAIANTYYLAGMLSGKDEGTRQVAQKVKVLWPNQQDRGAHVNISGAAITQYAPNKEAAVKLLEFMMTAESQNWYATTNHEYPILEGVEWSAVLKSFAQFQPEEVKLNRVGELNSQAVQLMDRAGWK
ncbi:MAG: iron(III) transport system substrate-binding protein [Paraglaciecola sp.]|jgi:iron(III) transport system substrate-binding protein